MNAITPTPASAPLHRRVTVAVMGAGFGGLAMTIRLLQSGYTDIVLLEKAASAGGTWRENTYPGAGCDIQSHMYSYSFEGKSDWSKRYANWREIYNYIQDTAQKHHVSDYTRFNSEVTGAHFDEQTGRWTVLLKDGDTIDCQYFVMAAGPLHIPQIPHINGIENFKGETFHSAQWNHDYDLKDKQVASIGTGASAIQYIPEIAPLVKQLYVFQRTPAWVIPRDDRRYLSIEKTLFEKFPVVRQLHRMRIYWSNESRLLPVIKPAIAEQVQKLAKLWIKFQVKDAKLVEKLTPDYTFGCKRILVSNKYYPTFNRKNVELVTDAIQEVREYSIVTKDGVERPVDCIIYGTGFITDPRIYLKDFPLTGLPGHDLMHDWKDGAEAYLGVMTTGFPNLFQLIGPNSGLGHNSMIFMIETQADYIIKLIQANEKHKTDYINVKAEVQTKYNQWLQAELKNTVWQSGCVSWYQQENGKNFTLWPGYTWQYWLKLRTVNPDNFEFSKAKAFVKVL